MSKNTETMAGDYVLGTGDDELTRLGLQHRVWREHMLGAWNFAGITTGSRVLDVGCGPGYATVDLAEIVGPAGQVIGIERSPHYYEHASHWRAARGLSQVSLKHADLMNDAWDVSGMDAAWCRWVACFVSSPSVLVNNMAASLRTGGVAIFHEYVHYRSWRLAPLCAAHDDFVERVVDTWRESGGEPDIARELPTLLAEAGMRVTRMRTHMFAITARDFMWQWPVAFIETNIQRQIELGRATEEWGKHTRREIARACESPHAVMITPAVLEVVAEKM